MLQIEIVELKNKNFRRGASLAEVFYSLSSLTASAAMFSTVMPF